MRTPRVLAFGSLALDLRDERLWRGEDALRLTNKAFAVLRYLVESAEQLVTQEALLETVWPDTLVSDAALTVCIRELCQVLGDRARTPQYIETVHRRGYRCIAPGTAGGQSIASPERHRHRPAAPVTPRNTSHAAFHAPMVVGREAELDQLQQCFAKALQGERQVVFVTGEAGIGKTTLVDTFVAQIRVENSPWIGHGQCIEQYGTGEAYQLVRVVFKLFVHGNSFFGLHIDRLPYGATFGAIEPVHPHLPSGHWLGG